MPVYEFVCRECKKRFQVVKPITQAPKTAKCPKCGSRKVDRIWSPVFIETTKKS
jgi:putative FmdB family regulatory protein